MGSDDDKLGAAVGCAAPRPLSGLLSELSGELSTMVRQEMQLGVRRCSGPGRDPTGSGDHGQGRCCAGRGGGRWLITVVFGASAAARGLAQVVVTGWALLLVTVVWLLVRSVAGLLGLRKLRQVQTPAQTVKSLKEDVAWAKSQKS